MEFATDVVGDDIVQQTSGEALRNTVTYAVGPGVSASKYFSLCVLASMVNHHILDSRLLPRSTVLVVLGAGLLVFSISAFGRSRSTEQEAAMVDKAFSSIARSIQSSARDGIASLASLPGLLLSFLLNVASFPYRMAAKAVFGIGGAGASVISGAINSIQAIPAAIAQAAISLLQRCGRFLSEGASISASRIVSVISGSFIGATARFVSKASGAVVATLSAARKAANYFVCDSVGVVGASLSKMPSAMTGALSASRIFVVELVASASQIAGNLATDSAVLVKVCLSALAAMVASARTVTSEMAKRFRANSASAGANVSSSIAAASKGFIVGVASASAHVSSFIAGVASWCLGLFRRDGRSDSTTSTAMS